jgi:steroid delta-isomerase-like uncharacterized protein
MHMTIDENKALIRRLEEALNSGRVDAGLDLFAEEFLYNGQRIDRQELVQVRAPFWTAMPDIRWTIEALVAEEDQVATLWTVEGTHGGEFFHPALGRASPTGKPVRSTYMVIHRIVDGRIVEARDVSDRLTLLRQLGVIRLPDAGTKT